MIQNKRMKLVKKDKEYEYYIFKPTLFQQYSKLEPKEGEPKHRKLIIHKIHMLMYKIRGGGVSNFVYHQARRYVFVIQQIGL